MINEINAIPRLGDEIIETQECLVNTLTAKHEMVCNSLQLAAAAGGLAQTLHNSTLLHLQTAGLCQVTAMLLTLVRKQHLLSAYAHSEKRCCSCRPLPAHRNFATATLRLKHHKSLLAASSIATAAVAAATVSHHAYVVVGA
jgi:hypothetical protein